MKLITELEPLDEKLKPEIEVLLAQSQISGQNGKILFIDLFVRSERLFPAIKSVYFLPVYFLRPSVRLSVRPNERTCVRPSVWSVVRSFGRSVVPLRSFIRSLADVRLLVPYIINHRLLKPKKMLFSGEISVLKYFFVWKGSKEKINSDADNSKVQYCK